MEDGFNPEELARLTGDDVEDVRGVKALMNAQGFAWPGGRLDVDRYQRFIASKGPGFRVFGARRYRQEAWRGKRLRACELAAVLDFSERWVQALRGAMAATGEPWAGHEVTEAQARNWMVERGHPSMRAMEGMIKSD